MLPVLELAVAIEIGRWVGALPVLGALLLIAVAGMLLVRRQGVAAWRSLNRSIQAGEPPSTELADATVLVLAGVLLTAPGFVTDVLALILLFPPTRPFARRPLQQVFLRAAADRAAQQGQGTFMVGERPGGDVVEGEIVQDDPPGDGRH